MRAQFAPCLPCHQRRALKCEGGHDGCDDEVGPSCAGAEHAGSRQQHRQVADHVVPRANPGRPHIGIAFRKAQSSANDAALGRASRDADRAHVRRSPCNVLLVLIVAPSCSPDDRWRVNRQPDIFGVHGPAFASITGGIARDPDGAMPALLRHGRYLRRATATPSRRHEADGVVRAVPRKSSASACSDAEPAARPAAILIRNMTALIASTAQSIAAIGDVAPVRVRIQRRRGAAAVGHAPQAMQRGRTSQPRGHRGQVRLGQCGDR